MTSSTVTMLYNHRYCIILEHFQLALKALCTARIMPLMCGRYWKSRASRGRSLNPRELRDLLLGSRGAQPLEIYLRGDSPFLGKSLDSRDESWGRAGPGNSAEVPVCAAGLPAGRPAAPPSWLSFCPRRGAGRRRREGGAAEGVLPVKGQDRSAQSGHKGQAGPPSAVLVLLGAPAFEQVRSRKRGCPCLTPLRGPKRKQRNWAPAPSDNGAALWTCALRLQSPGGQDPLPGLPAPPWGPDLLLGFVVLSDYSNPRQGPRNGGTHV